MPEHFPSVKLAMRNLTEGQSLAVSQARPPRRPASLAQRTRVMTSWVRDAAAAAPALRGGLQIAALARVGSDRASCCTAPASEDPRGPFAAVTRASRAVGHYWGLPLRRRD